MCPNANALILVGDNKGPSSQSFRSGSGPDSDWHNVDSIETGDHPISLTLLSEASENEKPK